MTSDWESSDQVSVVASNLRWIAKVPKGMKLDVFGMTFQTSDSWYTRTMRTLSGQKKEHTFTFINENVGKMFAFLKEWAEEPEGPLTKRGYPVKTMIVDLEKVADAIGVIMDTYKSDIKFVTDLDEAKGKINHKLKEYKKLLLSCDPEAFKEAGKGGGLDGRADAERIGVATSISRGKGSPGKRKGEKKSKLGADKDKAQKDSPEGLEEDSEDREVEEKCPGKEKGRSPPLGAQKDPETKIDGKGSTDPDTVSSGTPTPKQDVKREGSPPKFGVVRSSPPGSLKESVPTLSATPVQNTTLGITPAQSQTQHSSLASEHKISQALKAQQKPTQPIPIPSRKEPERITPLPQISDSPEDPTGLDETSESKEEETDEPQED